MNRMTENDKQKGSWNTEFPVQVVDLSKSTGGAHRARCVAHVTIQDFIIYLDAPVMSRRLLRAASEQVLRPGRRAPVPRLGPVLQALRVVRNHAAGQSPGLELRCGLGLQLRRGLGLGV